MADRILQCCYSNLVSGTGTSGWRVAAASEDLPLDVKDAYAKMQDTNVVSMRPIDEAGSPLNLYELVADGKYVYVTRITYGLKDAGGRENNMLSHGYIFPITRELLSDPNSFLTVADTNFTGDIEVAAEIRTSFDRLEPFTVDSAMEAAGLDEKRYLELVYAVYAQREQKRTLYLITSKGEAMVRPTLFCLLSAVPFALRREFSCASAAVSQNTTKSFIITSKCAPGDLFYNLDTGENNVLAERAMKKYARWGFADYYVKNRDHVDGVDFFGSLEDTALKLGDAGASKFRVLKIAFQILMSEDVDGMEFEDARARLYEALTTALTPSDFMDAYIASLLKRINETQKPLDEMVDVELVKKLGESTLPALVEQGDQYVVNKILGMEPEQAGLELSKFSDEEFRRLAGVLGETAEGVTCLDCYFAMTVPVEPTWGDIRDYAGRLEDFCGDNAPKTMQKLEEAGDRLYRRSVAAGENYRLEFANYVENFELINSFTRRYSDDEIQGKAREKATELFWESYSFANFKYSDSDVRTLSLPNNPKSSFCMALMDAFGMLADSEDPNEARRAVKAFQSLMARFGYAGLLSGDEKTAIYDNVKDCLGGRMVSNRCKLYLIIFSNGLDVFGRLEELCELLDLGQTEQFILKYGETVDVLPDRTFGENGVRYFNLFLLEKIKRYRIFQYLSIDVLLTVGKTMYGNPFEIVDHLDEFRLDEEWEKWLERDPETVLKNSRLLHLNEYGDYADDFMRGKSEFAPYVRDWMKEIRRKSRDSKISSAMEKTTKKLGSLFGKRLG